MSDVILVAIISAGAAVAVALLSSFIAHWLNQRSLNEQAVREERRRERDWQRQQLAAGRERRDQYLREIWEWVLITSARLYNIDTTALLARKHATFQDSASYAAAKAYAVALLMQPELRDEVKRFHVATMALDPYHWLEDPTSEQLQISQSQWTTAYKSLESFIKYLADREH